MGRYFLATVFVLALASAHAQAPSPAQMGITPTTTPEVLQVLDNTKTWVPIGRVDPVNHVFTGYGAGTDVRTFGCVANGADQTTCIQNALNSAADCVIIPASATGFVVTGTLTVSKCLRGTVWNPSTASVGFSGSSFLVCNNQVAQPCVVVNQSFGVAAQIENLTLVGSGATPVAGAIGLQWKGGYNLVLTNVQSTNFDTCVYFGPAVASAGPISMHSINPMLSRCQKHYVVNDGVPELYFLGGRWGENGGADYNSADDFVYLTKTTTAGAGAGPNTLVLDAVQINPGGRTVGCAFRWDSFTGTGGGWGASKISNSHIEIMDAGYTGTKTQGMFCVDNTVTYVPGMRVSANTFATDGGATLHPLFQIASTVPWTDEVSFSGNYMGVAAFSLTVSGVIGGHGPKFNNNYLPGGSTFIAGDTSATMALDNNVLGAFTISGQWANLFLTQNSGTVTDNATGNVRATGVAPIAWTPALSLGGGSVTYSAQAGVWTRTQEGGLLAWFNITLNGVSSPTGAVQITGMPKSCTHPNAGPLALASGFTGLTGVPIAGWSNGGASINLLQTVAAGLVSLAGTALTATTTMMGTVTCGQAS